MRRSVAFFCALAVILIAVFSYTSYAAPPEVYFIAVNDTLLPLDASTMPFVKDGVYYVPQSIFKDGSLGLWPSYNDKLYTLTLYNKNYQITFNSLEGVAFDRNEQYPVRLAANSYGTIFVPAAFVCEKFDIQFTELRTTPAYTLRLVSKSTAQSSDAFIEANRADLATWFMNYLYPPTPSPSRVTGTTGKPSSPPSPSPSPSPPPPEPKAVYITFEGGPTSYTPEILDLLRAYDIKATFFAEADGVADFGSSVRRIAGEGHSLGVSSYSADTVSDIAGALLDDLQTANSAIDVALGTRTRILRLAGGSDSAQYSDTDRDSLIEAGYRYWDWTIDGTNKTSASRLSSAVISGLRVAKASSIIRLRQDEMTVEALDDILFHIKNGNYTVRAISASEMPINFLNDVRSAVG